MMKLLYIIAMTPFVIITLWILWDEMFNRDVKEMLAAGVVFGGVALAGYLAMWGLIGLLGGR